MAHSQNKINYSIKILSDHGDHDKINGLKVFWKLWRINDLFKMENNEKTNCQFTMSFRNL